MKTIRNILCICAFCLVLTGCSLEDFNQESDQEPVQETKDSESRITFGEMTCNDSRCMYGGETREFYVMAYPAGLTEEDFKVNGAKIVSVEDKDDGTLVTLSYTLPEKDQVRYEDYGKTHSVYLGDIEDLENCVSYNISTNILVMGDFECDTEVPCALKKGEKTTVRLQIKPIVNMDDYVIEMQAGYNDLMYSEWPKYSLIETNIDKENNSVELVIEITGGTDVGNYYLRFMDKYMENISEFAFYNVLSN